MKCGSNELPVRSPLLPGADQQTFAQPRLEESIFVRLLDVDVAVQDLLDVVGMGEEHDEVVAQPAPRHVPVNVG